MRAPQDQRAAGYVLPATALLIVPLLVFAALAVDVGGWTVEANRAQAAADAAALAGAPLLPDNTKATQAAEYVAAQNGYVDGVDGTDVSVEFPGNQSIRVVITVESELYYSGVVLDSPVTIGRFADAKALSPVGLSSPTNVLGFGPYSLDSSPVSNYWILENNECSVAHWGDIKAARYLSSPWCGAGLGLPENPEFKGRTDGRDGGYFYVVKIPSGMKVSSRLYIFDPGKCPGYGSKPADGSWNRPDGEGTTLEFRQWSTNNSPLVPTDDFAVTGWFRYDDCAADLPYLATSWTDQTDGWTATNFMFPPNTSGDTEYHLIQTRTLAATVRGWNHYSFWVRPDDGTTSCLTIGSDSCPSIGAETWAPTQSQGAVVGDPMELFLAEVGPEHAGRVMTVRLWDPGEGMNNIQVIDPLGESLDFTWTSDDTLNYAGSNPHDLCAGKPCLYLDPTFSGYPAKLSNPGWGNHWRFNGRVVNLNVELDDQVDFPAYATSPNGFWFRIRFEPTPTNLAREWASFGVSIGGDPIRLTD